jgi:hypothetical protein
MGAPRLTISTWRLPVPILLLPISKDKLIATIAEVPGFYTWKICISFYLKIERPVLLYTPINCMGCPFNAKMRF